MNNYNELINKPTINNKELIGDLSCEDFDIATKEDLEDFYTKEEIDAMIDATED